MKKMRIRIGNDGKTTIHVEGVAGPDCLGFTEALEKALGVVEARTHTEDFELDENQLEERQDLEDKA